MSNNPKIPIGQQYTGKYKGPYMKFDPIHSKNTQINNSSTTSEGQEEIYNPRSRSSSINQSSEEYEYETLEGEYETPEGEYETLEGEYETPEGEYETEVVRGLIHVNNKRLGNKYIYIRCNIKEVEREAAKFIKEEIKKNKSSSSPYNIVKTYIGYIKNEIYLSVINYISGYNKNKLNEYTKNMFLGIIITYKLLIDNSKCDKESDQDICIQRNVLIKEFIEVLKSILQEFRNKYNFPSELRIKLENIIGHLNLEKTDKPRIYFNINRVEQEAESIAQSELNIITKNIKSKSKKIVENIYNNYRGYGITMSQNNKEKNCNICEKELLYNKIAILLQTLLRYVREINEEMKKIKYMKNNNLSTNIYQYIENIFKNIIIMYKLLSELNKFGYNPDNIKLNQKINSNLTKIIIFFYYILDSIYEHFTSDGRGYTLPNTIEQKLEKIIENTNYKNNIITLSSSIRYVTRNK